MAPKIPPTPNSRSTTRSLPFLRKFHRSRDESVVTTSVCTPKRIKSSLDQEIRHIIQDINMAVTKHQRTISISNAIRAFDHKNKDRHDKEVRLGATTALFQKLLVTQVISEKRDDKFHEICMICTAFELTYRCSSHMRETSFSEIGPELVKVFLRIIRICDESKGPKCDTIITHILLVFQYFARVETISRSLLSLPSVLSTLALIVNSTHLSNGTRAMAMGTLADLACAEANGAKMARIKGLLSSVLEVANFDSSKKTRESAARAIQNIIFSVDDGIPTVSMEKMLHTLLYLFREENTKARTYALGAMQNITSWEGHPETIMKYKNGAVLQNLGEIVSSDDSIDVRRRSLNAISNLITTKTVHRIGEHKYLLTVLMRTASSDKDADLRESAANALTWIAEDMKSRLIYYPELFKWHARSIPEKSGM